MIIIRKEVTAPSSLFRGRGDPIPSLAGTSLCIAPLSLTLAGSGRPGSTHVTTLLLTYCLLIARQTRNSIMDPGRGEVR